VRQSPARSRITKDAPKPRIRCPRIELTECALPTATRGIQSKLYGTTRVRGIPGQLQLTQVRGAQTSRPLWLSNATILTPKFIPTLPPLSTRTGCQRALDTQGGRTPRGRVRQVRDINISSTDSSRAGESKGVAVTEVMQSFWRRLRKIDRDDIMRHKRVWYIPMDKHEEDRHVNAQSGAGSTAPLTSKYSCEGAFKVVRGEHVAFRFEIIDSLGNGNFGQVVRCFDHKNRKLVALKIINNNPLFTRQSLLEVEVLARLQGGSSRIVRMFEHFKFRHHVCAVFELLHMNMYEFLLAREFRSLSVPEIRCIALQLVEALVYLKRIGIVHCDIKPENILLDRSGSLDVKLIDFGSACYAEQTVYTYVQSRFYRAPEVMLGMEYSHPIDMWSLACVLAELSLGAPLFSGDDEAAILSTIAFRFGAPPNRILMAATNTERRVEFTVSQASSAIERSGTSRKLAAVDSNQRTSSQSCAAPPIRPRHKSAISEDVTFDKFLSRALDWDPARRLTPEAASRHAWLASALPRCR